MNKTNPVFYDPYKKRWPRLCFGAIVMALAFGIIFIVLAISIISNPVLTSLRLRQANKILGTVKKTHLFANYNQSLAKTKYLLTKEITKENNIKSTAFHGEGYKNIGFYVNWDKTSLNSLVNNIDKLDVVIGEWLHLTKADGSIIVDNSGSYSTVLNIIRQKKPSLQVLALVNNFQNNKWETENLTKMLASRANRQKAIDDIKQFIIANKLNGVSIDFEAVDPLAQENFQIFMQELYKDFRLSGLIVTINLPVDNSDFDYVKFSKNSDYVILMAYDEHWAAGDPGPIAPLPWFTEVVRKRAIEIGNTKIIIGLGNYGYDWVKGKTAEEQTYEEAILSARDSEATITLDPNSLNPFFIYNDNNQDHEVWFLDASTIYNELVMTNNIKPYGFAVWRLGSEDPSIWEILNHKPLNKDSAKQLENIAFGYNVDYQGFGEILKVISTPQDGKRNFVYDDKQNLITNEKYELFPSPYVVERYGKANKKIALTFDDGPDPIYTPQILDILKQYNVKASFFIIGKNGDDNPGLVKRIYNEGHELGNHTYTHPNIAHIGVRQLELEVSATERLLEATINHQSHLFRSPYAEDSEPDTADEVKPIFALNNLGYLDVGMQIDPNDWSRPGVDNIVKITIDQATNNSGNIVLLHDSGGDRSQTIAALPTIITDLRKRGYEFTTIAGLLNQSRDQVMPPVAGNLWENLADRWGFNFLRYVGSIIHYIFIIGIILGLIRIVFIIYFAIRQKFIRQKFSDFNGSVAVIIAAYNESKVINQTISSLLTAKPNNFSIIVVDDGSSDNTYETILSEFKDESRLSVYQKDNGGKSSALNFALAKTQADIIITLDADTIFAQDTINKLVRHFSDDRVGAVAGNTKVGNRINLLTRLQALEYITSQNLDRRAFAVLNTITVVPGAVGAWRRQLVEAAGGFQGDTLAEDADLTMAIRELGYKVVYDEEAYALTEAPDKARAFIRQRYRWMFGTLQAAWKHRYILFKKRYGWYGIISLPNIFIFQIIFPLLAPLLDLLAIVVVALSYLNKFQHPDQYSFEAMWKILFFYILFLVVDYLSSLIAFLMEKKEDKKLLIWLLIQRFYYRQLMYVVSFKSFLSTLKGHEVGWNKLERKGTVSNKF